MDINKHVEGSEIKRGGRRIGKRNIQYNGGKNNNERRNNINFIGSLQKFNEIIQ